MAKKRHSSQINPRSLANLKPGSEPDYGEVKKVRSIAVTDTGYEGLRAKAQACGCSLSEYLERLGRGLLYTAEDVVAVTPSALSLQIHSEPPNSTGRG